ncbi:sodium/glutamate symporter [Haloplasma contractile]|uniref:sodium/glutamate symporter n=1 Tax=Haloplasma contractile TaxID=471825 RepID=UPI00021224FC|nr:sodium/glutamate symporter [Haloplasma contractile]
MLLAFVLLGVFLLIAKWIRLKVPVLQNYFIPSSLIAGFIGLILNEQLIQKFILIFLPNDRFSFLTRDVIPNSATQVWKEIPELFITIIFASLFLGKKIPNLKKVWNIAKPQIAFGQTIAWGQYVVGILVTLLILKPFFGANILSGVLIEISFQGGAGTAAGLAGTFDELGFSHGKDLGIGIATFGILSGMIIGVIMINIGIRKNKATVATKPDQIAKEERLGVYKFEEADSIRLTTRSHSIETISIHLAFILLSVGIGAIFFKGLLFIENSIWGPLFDIYLIKYIPLFPLAMIGGVIVQVMSTRFEFSRLINRKMILHIQNFTLDFLIVSAVASISLSVISEHTSTFIILLFTGILWNIAAFLFIAPRMISRFWFERGIIDFGQSMGMTTTGLLLLQIVDPDKKTPTFESFGYKQLFFEPIVGGGFFTAASMPLLAEFGPIVMLYLTGGLFLFWLIFGIVSNKVEAA